MAAGKSPAGIALEAPFQIAMRVDFFLKSVKIFTDEYISKAY